MALSTRQQGEVAYLRGMLGLDELESRLAKLEGDKAQEPKTLEERHSAGLANLAKLDVYPATPFYPEGESAPEPEDQPMMAGSVNQDETVREANPAVGESPVDELDELELEDLEEDYNGWTVDQLKSELKNRELSTSGSKSDLVSRLEEDDKE